MPGAAHTSCVRVCVNGVGGSAFFSGLPEHLFAWRRSDEAPGPSCAPELFSFAHSGERIQNRERD